MNLYCTCTNHTPDFVPALLLAYSIPLEQLLLADVWLCYDCFEHHIDNNYNIRTVPDRHWHVEVELSQDEVPRQ